MSVLINNDLIWVSIPRCASMSIEQTLMHTPELRAEHILNNYHVLYDAYLKDNKTPFHYHYQLNDLYDRFGNKETICITRDWFERWLKALKYLFSIIEYEKLTSVIEWKDIDNDFLYSIFNSEFSNDIHTLNDDKLLKSFSKLVKEDISTLNSNVGDYMLFLLSQNFWKSGNKCKYEFDINEIYKFEDFISNRYGVNFKIPKINTESNNRGNIVIDDKLRGLVWNLFEKPFVKKLF